ncbi:MAG: sulfatase, partial [Phycisphaeraceae bacterium]|nr:sulfatase [Phycisphaeraceae bacterium]
MDSHASVQRMLTRRSFLGRASLGLGALAAAGLSRDGGGPPHHPARIRRVIFLCMAGGPSQFETFDWKPQLEKMDGQPMPPSFTAGQPIAQLQGKKLKVLRPLCNFGRHGESGQMIGDYLPWTAKLADDIAIIRSMHTTQINHDPAHTVMNTGTAISGRPSMGSWVTYGLGSEANDLPGFVVLTSVKGRNPQPIASRQWHSGFLPSRFQGVEMQSTGDPVHYLSNPPGVTRHRQREVVDAIGALDRLRNAGVQDPEVDTRLSQYELAFRMQRSAPKLMDFRDEDPRVLEMYGAKGMDGSFAANCLLARRLAERGVRFIQLYHRGWDHHGDLDKWMKVCCGATDRATWALVADLKQRGLLDDTLVVWGGEFGRTPMFQGKGKTPGRDHHIKGFSMWLAGG